MELNLQEAAEMELDYSQLLDLEYKAQVKAFVEWFIVKYNRFIEKRCRVAAIRVGMADLWEDLKSESILQAYEIGNRYDSAKGDILKLLISSLWLYPMREDVVNRVKCYAQGDEYYLEAIKHLAITETEMSAAIIHYSAIDDPSPVYSIDSICGSLEEHDRILLAFKYKLGLPNTVIAALCGLNESTIRSRYNNAIEKLQAVVKVKDNMIVAIK